MAKVDFDRGNSNNLSGTSIQDGRFIYTQDTQKLYLDDSNNRVELNPNPDWNASSGNAYILNKPDIDAMQTAINGKANTSHTHTKSDITDLSNATSSVAGLMSSTDKAKLDRINITYTSSKKLITFSF